MTKPWRTARCACDRCRGAWPRYRRALLVLAAVLAPAGVWPQDSESIEPVGSDAIPGAYLLQLAAPTELGEDDRLLTRAIRTTLAIELGNLGYEVIEPQPGTDDREPDLIVEYLVYALTPRVHVSVSVWLGDRSARVAAMTERLRANVTLYNRMTALARATLQTAARELADNARVALGLSADAPPELVIAPRWSVGLRYTLSTRLGLGIVSRGYLLPGRLWIALEADGYFTGGSWSGPGEHTNILRHLEPRALAGVRLFGNDHQRWGVTLTSGFGAFFTWIDNDLSDDTKAFIDPYLVLFGAGLEYRFGAITVDMRSTVLAVLDWPGQLLPSGIGASRLNPRLSVGATWNW